MPSPLRRAENGLRSTPPVFLSLRTLYSNMGDGLIVHALIRSILDVSHEVHAQSERGPQAFIDYTLAGLDASRLHLVEQGYWRRCFAAALRTRWQRLLGRRATPPPVLFLTPGHQFTELGLRPAVRKALFGLMLLGLRLCGMRIARLGFSLDPPTSRRARLLERLMASSCTVYAVRDAVSFEVARSIGIARVRSAPDLAVLLHDPGEPVGGRSGVAVSLRDLGSQDARLASSLRSLRDHRGQTPDIVAVSQTEQDLAPTVRCLREAELEPIAELELRRSVESVDALLDHYRSYELVLSNRLHVVLAALAAGTPSIALVDARVNIKVIAALERMGLENIVVALGPDVASPAPQLDIPGLIQRARETEPALRACELQLQDTILTVLRT